MLNYAQIPWERLPHITESNYVTLLQLSMGSTFWKICMNNFMKTLHFTFAGLILNSDLLFVVWKRLMKTKMTFRCQTCWIHFRNALWTHEGLLRRCLKMKRPIFKEKKLTRKKKWKTFFWADDWWLKLEKLRQECKTLQSFRTLKLFWTTFVISRKKQFFSQNFQLFCWIWVLFFSSHQFSFVESKSSKVKIHFELETTKTFSFCL